MFVKNCIRVSETQSEHNFLNWKNEGVNIYCILRLINVYVEYKILYILFKMLLVFYNCIICLQNICVYFLNWYIISIFCPACNVLYYQAQWLIYYFYKSVLRGTNNSCLHTLYQINKTCVKKKTLSIVNRKKSVSIL